MLICFYLLAFAFTLLLLAEVGVDLPEKPIDQSWMVHAEPIPNMWLVHKRDPIPSCSVLATLLEGDEGYCTPLSWAIYI